LAATKVGRALPRRPNSRKNKRSDVLARPAASIAVLAGGEVRAKRPLCPARIGGKCQDVPKRQSRLPQGHFVLQCQPAVAENQPANKNRMTTKLSNFAARLRETILSEGRVPRGPDSELRTPNSELRNHNGDSCNSPLRDFNSLALELFALQFKHNAAYRKICEARGLAPGVVEHWTRIPAVPTSAFKELELTCLAPGERITVFHSSGTTEQKPSRHFHNAESLAVYEASLWSGFQTNVAIGAPNSDSACFQSGIVRADSEIGAPSARQFQLIILMPPPPQAPHSSLVHMFETVRQKLGGAETAFVGKLVADDGAWTLDFNAVVDALSSGGDGASPPPQTPNAKPLLLLGTAFSFVHLLDFLAERNLRFDLPAGSRVMETGGYKNRSRSIPKTELHRLITERLGVPSSHIICEYGMSELSSQAYDGRAALLRGQDWGRAAARPYRVFRFPPWARVQIISPETGCEVADGETGLIRVFDLANVFSVMAIQTEDLGIRRDEHFELIGRVALAEARGCSLMTV
jgi:hypothetical protein